MNQEQVNFLMKYRYEPLEKPIFNANGFGVKYRTGTSLTDEQFAELNIIQKAVALRITKNKAVQLRNLIEEAAKSKVEKNNSKAQETNENKSTKKKN